MSLIQIVNLCLMTINIFLAIYILLYKTEINNIKEKKIKDLEYENEILRKELSKTYISEKDKRYLIIIQKMKNLYPDDDLLILNPNNYKGYNFETGKFIKYIS